MKLVFTENGLVEVDDTVYRYDIINFLIEKFFPNECNYLEIGVKDPSQCFAKVKATNKQSVDPCLETDASVDYKMTSDDFFDSIETSNKKWDIIFIDGLHLADQVYLDINNSMKHLSKNGFVLLHDCNPSHWSHAHSDHDAYMAQPRNWNGTAWKAFYKFRNETDLQTYTVDTDQGIGVICNGIPKDNVELIHNPFYEYGVFSKNREESLGLISVEQFYKKYQ